MRKLVLILACAAAAVPAVALAADDGGPEVGGVTPGSEERRADARNKGKVARARLDRRAEKAEQARAKARAKKRAKKAAASQGGATAGGGGATPAHLQSIAACESGGNPRAIGGGGAYRGKYQFDRGTWASVGGSGDPAAAPEAEQDKRAAMLYARAGAAPWPVCGS
jgi:soluble lytic murein transglycosylase-like protein